MSTGRNTQLTNIANYNVNNLIFSDVQECPIPGDASGLTYKRINVGTTYPDGSSGDLIIKTTKCFSFGVSENLNGKTGQVDGYSFPLCLWSKDGKTKEEENFIIKIDELVEKIKQHIITDEVKENMGKFDLVYTDLRKLNPIYRKRDKKGKVIEEYGPVLYPKVIMNKKTGAILSAFYEENVYDDQGEPNQLDFTSLITNKTQKNYCNAIAAIKIESIYIGTNISLQVKLWEADVEIFNSKPQRLLRTSRPVVQKPRNVIIEESKSVQHTEHTEQSIDTSHNDPELSSSSDDEEDKQLVASDNDNDNDNDDKEKQKSVTTDVKKKVLKRKLVKKVINGNK